MMGLRRLTLAVCVLAACEIRVATQDNNNTVPVVCGNFIVEEGEVCDDGNTVDGDSCSADCLSDNTCGNGVVDTAMGETCDDGNSLGGDGCSADCKSDETCGNGVIDVAKGETCDDGDLQGGDGCSANCQSNEQCGNGVKDDATSPPEDCDDGPAGSATCDVNCTTATCGDFTVNALAGEQCDAGPDGNAQCDSNCTTALCGDGTVNTFRGEQCDDGNNATNDACIACKNAFCGDGFVRAGVEECDDANTNVTDACTLNCKAAFCGDGFVRAGVEQCDDGNQNNGDGCSASCQFEPKVYQVQLGGLINQNSSCDSTGANRFDGCSVQPVGFTWTDSSPFTPSQILVEFDNGINCVGPETRSTTLNNISTGSFQSIGGNCFCDPSQGPAPAHTLNQWMFANPGSYVVNGTNTFMLSASASCFGFSNTLFSGEYIRITVFP